MCYEKQQHLLRALICFLIRASEDWLLLRVQTRTAEIYSTLCALFMNMKLLKQGFCLQLLHFNKCECLADWQLVIEVNK